MTINYGVCPLCKEYVRVHYDKTHNDYRTQTHMNAENKGCMRNQIVDKSTVHLNG